MDCLFCKIAQGEIASEIVYQDDQVLAFNDINPQAPTHILIVPHEHIATINDIEEQHEALVGHMVQVAQQSFCNARNISSNDLPPFGFNNTRVQANI